MGKRKSLQWRTRFLLATTAVLGAVASPLGRAATSANATYVCVGTTDRNINPAAGGCPSGSLLIRVASFSMSRPTTAAGPNSGRNMPEVLTLTVPVASQTGSLRGMATGKRFSGVALATYTTSLLRPRIVEVFSKAMISGLQIRSSGSSPTETIQIEYESVAMYSSGTSSSNSPSSPTGVSGKVN
jgi:hypothetical protein